LALPPRELRRKFRSVGLLLERLALGEDGEPVKAMWPPRTIEHHLSFEEEAADQGAIEYALSQCARQIACALAREREFCRTLTLQVVLADGSHLSKSESLALPLDDADTLARAARRLLGRLMMDQPLSEVCLKASGLGTGSGVQMALLDDNQYARGL